MKEQFVTYEIALKLKELGFDEPCFGYYRPMKEWMMEGTKFNPERHFHGCNWVNSDNSMYFMYRQNSFGDRDSVVKNSEFTKAVENTAVPLWQQAIDWLREEKNLFIHIIDSFHISSNSPQYKYHIYPYNYKAGCKDAAFYGDWNIDYLFVREQAILKAIELCQKEK